MPTNSLILEGRTFLGRAWQLAKPYWRFDERRSAWLLLVTIVSLSLCTVYLLVILNDWNRQFFNAIEQKNKDDFYRLLIEFCGIAFAYIVVAAARSYLRQSLEMRWRIWLTRTYIGEWLGDQVYYRLEQNPRGTDNPDQRIADDLRQFTSTSLALTLDLLQQIVTFASFLVILWTVSGALAVTIGETVWNIPGYMVWVALLYAIAGSIATFYVGRPLIGLNFRQERFEADFRFSLVRMREHAEGIALYGGERAEHAHLQDNVEGIRSNWWQLMRAHLRLNLLTNTYGQIAVIFPFFVAAPRYFAGTITFGTLTQIADAFGTVQSSLSWFVQSYASLAGWKASVDRLLTFHDAVNDAAGEARKQPGVKRVDHDQRTIQAVDLGLALPNGRVILTEGSFAIKPGARTLLAGPSGSGKSTLFRAIAGIWPYGGGAIRIPAGARVMFLPQKPYIPIGSLRAAVTYPSVASAFDEGAISEALRLVQLDGFVERLDESRNWSTAMSGGEQQKLAIARALLAQPEWLFLDEATSSLDEPTEKILYELLMTRLPDAAIVSIAHRSQVATFHTSWLQLSGGRLVH
ncbi:MAG: ABC transporter ATP-binding protein/permease [Betaproteobacteria bacterium]|nr:ABC transporter ATP-binding protein/permease [Betaproteobacteria bacterium]